MTPVVSFIAHNVNTMDLRLAELLRLTIGCSPTWLQTLRYLIILFTKSVDNSVDNMSEVKLSFCSKDYFNKMRRLYADK